MTERRPNGSSPPRPASSRRRPAAHCLVVVAAAGYGKTAELESLAIGLDALFLSSADAAHWAGQPGPMPDDVRHVLVDDFSLLEPGAAAAVAARLGSLGPDTTVTVASRHPIAAEHLAAIGRAVVELGPDDLALDFLSTTELLRDEHAVDDADVANVILRLTSGWPELVKLAADECAGLAPHEFAAALTEPGTVGAAWFTEAVGRDLPPSAAAVLDAIADLDPVTPSLVERIRGGAPDDRAGLEHLFRVGLLRPTSSPRYPGRRSLSVVPLVGEWMTRSRARVARSGDDADRARLCAAADWYAGHRYPWPAARALAASGDRARCEEVVAAHGESMLAGGFAHEVAGLLGTWGDPLPRAHRLILGDALRMTGDVTEAGRALDALDGDRDDRGPDLAWRLAAARYLRADYAAASDACRHRPPAPGRDNPVDVVRALAYRARCAFMLGDVDASGATATEALGLAQQLDDDRAIAVAHLTCALTTPGARRGNHLASALAAARRCGDLVTAAWALVNQADNHLAGAEYAQALADAREALDLAEFLSPGILVSGLHNVGEALRGLGRCDEARPYFERSVAICRRLGLDRTAGGLWGLAEIDRQLGRRDQALARYTEVVDLARDSGERQVLVPALAGLARVMCTGDQLDDSGPAEAVRVADEGIALACPEFSPLAHVARGWVALACADAGAALEHAAVAASGARTLQSPADLAEALELQAAVTADAAEARACAHQALEVWARGGAELAANRVRAWLGEARGATGADRGQAKAARRWLRSCGVDLGALPVPLSTPSHQPVQIRVLGGFEVLVAGQPVPVPAWKSRQARSLLKILAARQGRPVTRAELCELLWPDDDPQRTGHRLSVLLSAVRTVLDPDRTVPPDHYLKSDRVGVSLDVTNASVDATRFLHDCAEAASLIRAGESAAARVLLDELDAAHRGDAFEDDPYAVWADGLREEVRAGWLRSQRLLARLAVDDDEPDVAVTCLVRLLAADPFDEPAHRQLVGLLVDAGRHGEARRAFDRWEAAMRAIDAPLPDARVLCGSRRVLIAR